MNGEEKSEILRMVRKEIASQLNVILNGVSSDSKDQTESIAAMFPGMTTITDRPTVKPYGFHSRVPDGVLSVIARIGDHAGSRYVIGHRDKDRPPVEVGESVIYSRLRQLRVELEAIRLGGPDSAQPIVLGAELKSFLLAFLDAFDLLTGATATIGGSVASITGLFGPGAYADPITGPIAMALAGVQAGMGASDAATAGVNAETADQSFVSNDAILSDESFARKGP